MSVNRIDIVLGSTYKLNRTHKPLENGQAAADPDLNKDTECSKIKEGRSLLDTKICTLESASCQAAPV